MNHTEQRKPPYLLFFSLLVVLLGIILFFLYSSFVSQPTKSGGRLLSQSGEQPIKNSGAHKATQSKRDKPKSEEKEPASSQIPASGVCLLVKARVVQLHLKKDVPAPRCVKVSSKQQLQIINDTDTKIVVTIGHMQFSLPSGESYTISDSVGSYLAIGVHKLRLSVYAGPEIWVQ